MNRRHWRTAIQRAALSPCSEIVNFLTVFNCSLNYSTLLSRLYNEINFNYLLLRTSASRKK